MNQEIVDLLLALCNPYGVPTPVKKEAMEQKWASPWNPTEPIKTLFDCLKECYITVMKSKPAYTVKQLIDHCIHAIQKTGHYNTTLKAWWALKDLDQHSWRNCKQHFTKAYDLNLHTTTTMDQAGKHGAANTAETTNDDSLASIQQSLTSMHINSNVAHQETNECMAELTTQLAIAQQ